MTEFTEKQAACSACKSGVPCTLGLSGDVNFHMCFRALSGDDVCSKKKTNPYFMAKQ